MNATIHNLKTPPKVTASKYICPNCGVDAGKGVDRPISRIDIMHRHVMAICHKHDITYSWSDRSGEAWAHHQSEQVHIPRIKSAISYAIALHEIGHILGRHQNSRISAVRERWAWTWARQNAIEWTLPMINCENRCRAAWESDDRRSKPDRVMHLMDILERKLFSGKIDQAEYDLKVSRLDKI